MKVIFMGSPNFAIPSLRALLTDPFFEVTSVYTAAPKIVRGKSIKTPVQTLAEQYDLPVYSPSTLQAVTLEPADVAVVAAYGLLLPSRILKAPKYGSINIHPSLLPRWRGASPIEHTLLYGDKKTGVCIMEVAPKLDAGDIYAQQVINVDEEDNFNSLHDKLATIGSSLLIEVLKQLPYLTPVPQTEEGVNYAHKIYKSMIDFTKPADYINRQIKAFSGMSFSFGGLPLKIISASYKLTEHNFTPGEIIHPEFYIACGQGFLIPQLVQPANKNPMIIKEFIKKL